MRRTLSILMPNFNHGAYIGQAIDAIVAQTRRPDVFIIMDDASTDRSVEIVAPYLKRHAWIRFERHERNMGMFKTMEDLLRLNTSEYFLASAADDFLLDGFVEQSMALLEQHPEAGICSGLSLVVSEAGVYNGVLPTGIPSRVPTHMTPEKVRQNLCRFGGWFSGNTAIYRSEALIAAGGWRPELRSFADGFSSHVVALRHGACFVPKPLAAWRRMDQGFLATTVQDQTKMRAIIDRAEYLMTQSPEYTRLFPEKYVRDWKKRQEYWMGAAQAKRAPTALGRWIALAGLQARCFTWPATPLLLRWALMSAAARGTQIRYSPSGPRAA